MNLRNVTLIIQGHARGALKKIQTLPQGTASKTLRNENNRFCKPSLHRVKRTKMNPKCTCYDISLTSTQRLAKFSSEALKTIVEKKHPENWKQHGSTDE